MRVFSLRNDIFRIQPVGNPAWKNKYHLNCGNCLIFFFRKIDMGSTIYFTISHRFLVPNMVT